MLVKNYYSITNQQSESDETMRFDVALHFKRYALNNEA